MLLPELAIALPDQALWAIVAGAVGLVFALVTAKKVMKADRGNERMVEIQGQHRGRRDGVPEARVPHAVRSSLSAWPCCSPWRYEADTIDNLGPDGRRWHSSWAPSCSSLCGIGGMKIATGRETPAPRRPRRARSTRPLNVAFPGGVVMGMLVMCVRRARADGPSSSCSRNTSGNVSDAADDHRRLLDGRLVRSRSFARVGGRDLHQGSRCRRRPGRQGRGRDPPRTTRANPAVHCRQCGVTTLATSRGMGGRPLRELRRRAARLDRDRPWPPSRMTRLRPPAVGFILRLDCRRRRGFHPRRVRRAREGRRRSPGRVAPGHDRPSAVLFAVLVFLIANLVLRAASTGADHHEVGRSRW